MKKFDEDFEKYLNLYLDDLLDEDESAEFENFLTENPEKMAELEAYKTLDFTARGELLPDLPEGYWEGLESRINKRVAALPENKGFWASFAQRFFSFNKTIKVAATALTLVTVFLISRQFIVGTKVSDFVERQPESMPLPTMLESEPPVAGMMGDTNELEIGSVAGVDSTKEPEQGLAADTMTDRILKEDIKSEQKEAETLHQEDKLPGPVDVADKVKAMPMPDIKVPGPAEIEEEFPAAKISPKLGYQKTELSAGQSPQIESENQIALQSLTDELIAETHKEIPDSTKKEKAKYNVATAVPESLMLVPLGGPGEEALNDSLAKYQDKSVLFDTLNPEADSEFIKNGQTVYARKDKISTGGLQSLRTADGLQPAIPLKLIDFPYLSPDEYSFTNPAPEENITGKFDMSLKDYAADSLQDEKNMLRLEGDSLIQAYNVASDPVNKLDLFRQIIKKYLVVIQESKSEPDAREAQNLLKLGLDNNLIYFPEYNSYRDSVKVYLREKR